MRSAALPTAAAMPTAGSVIARLRRRRDGDAGQRKGRRNCHRQFSIDHDEPPCLIWILDSNAWREVRLTARAIVLQISIYECNSL
jgi:hypothetical protein